MPVLHKEVHGPEKTRSELQLPWLPQPQSSKSGAVDPESTFRPGQPTLPTSKCFGMAAGTLHPRVALKMVGNFLPLTFCTS